MPTTRQIQGNILRHAQDGLGGKELVLRLQKDLPDATIEEMKAAFEELLEEMNETIRVRRAELHAIEQAVEFARQQLDLQK